MPNHSAGITHHARRKRSRSRYVTSPNKSAPPKTGPIILKVRSKALSKLFAHKLLAPASTTNPVANIKADREDGKIHFLQERQCPSITLRVPNSPNNGTLTLNVRGAMMPSAQKIIKKPSIKTVRRGDALGAECIEGAGLAKSWEGVTGGPF